MARPGPGSYCSSGTATACGGWSPSASTTAWPSASTRPTWSRRPWPRPPRGCPTTSARRPLPFYPWLRQIAWDRLVEAHRHHLHARRRSVAREVPGSVPLPDESVGRLADRLVARGTSPSRRMIRAELRDRLKAALDRLPPRDREVLVMRHLEQMEIAEIAAVLGLTTGAVMTRHTRALARLRGLLDDEGPEELP